LSTMMKMMEEKKGRPRRGLIRTSNRSTSLAR
jgi:hypothetical protein